MPDGDGQTGTEAGQVFALFNEIGILEHLSRAKLEAALPEGLIAPHFTVLNHLTRVRDGQTPQVMARAFQVPKTSMTHTLAGLAQRGLVEMRPNPADGRSKQVWLTEAGRRLREATIARLGEDFAAFRAAFPAEEVAAVVPVLTRMRQWLDAERDG